MQTSSHQSIWGIATCFVFLSRACVLPLVQLHFSFYARLPHNFLYLMCLVFLLDWFARYLGLLGYLAFIFSGYGRLRISLFCYCVVVTAFVLLCSLVTPPTILCALVMLVVPWGQPYCPLSRLHCRNYDISLYCVFPFKLAHLYIYIYCYLFFIM